LIAAPGQKVAVVVTVGEEEHFHWPADVKVRWELKIHLAERVDWGEMVN
jgi:hypothetical protein